jgi:shikimate dehydrogenase
VFKACLLGFPLTHSHSPRIFRKFFEISGIEGEYRAFEVATRRLFYLTVSELISTGYKGANITIPFKRDAFLYAERKSAVAVKCGSVNLLYSDADGYIFGENTDYFGFLESLKGAFDLSDIKNACVIGAGGSARTVIAVLHDYGARKIYVSTRSEAGLSLLLEELSSDIKSKVVPVRKGDVVRESFDILINCTPAGMYPNVDELPSNFQLVDNVKEDGLVYDLIYNPEKTALLKLAEQRGLKIKNGWEMLVLQALKTFEILADKKLEQSTILKEFQVIKR